MIYLPMNSLGIVFNDEAFTVGDANVEIVFTLIIVQKVSVSRFYHD